MFTYSTYVFNDRFEYVMMQKQSELLKKYFEAHG